MQTLYQQHLLTHSVLYQAYIQHHGSCFCYAPVFLAGGLSSWMMMCCVLALVGMWNGYLSYLLFVNRHFLALTCLVASTGPLALLLLLPVPPIELVTAVWAPFECL